MGYWWRYFMETCSTCEARRCLIHANGGKVGTIGNFIQHRGFTAGGRRGRRRR